MRLERPLVLGLDHLRGGLERRVDVAVLLLDVALAHRCLADVVVERGLGRERRRRLRPFDLELLHCLDRVPLARREHGEEAFLPHHLGARNLLDRRLVDFHGHRARDRGPDHARVQHARHLDVGAEVLLREHLRRHVLALDALADDLVVLGILRLRLAGRVERIAVFLVPGELDVEVLPADQVGIARLLGGIVLRVHDAVRDGELVGCNAELRRRHLDQHAARFRGGDAHLLAAILDAGRARGAALVDACSRVGEVDLDGPERHVELFRHDLADRGREAVAHVHLAEIGDDAAVGLHRDVGRELVRHERRLDVLRERGLVVEQRLEADAGTDRYDERAAGLEQGAARERGGLVHLGHDRLPQPAIAAAARLTARRMPMWVPQRHLRPSSACRISASVGFFLSRRNAAAVMIQPLMQ